MAPELHFSFVITKVFVIIVYVNQTNVFLSDYMLSTGGANHKVNYDVMLQVGQRLNEMETARAFQTIHVKYTQQ